MFSNKNSNPTDIVRELIDTYVDQAQAIAILDELFDTWVGSDRSSDTGHQYRNEVVKVYRSLRGCLEADEVREVCHD